MPHHRFAGQLGKIERHAAGKVNLKVDEGASHIIDRSEQQGGVKHRFQGGTEVPFTAPQRFFGLFDGADVHKADQYTVNVILNRAVGAHTDEEPTTGLVHDLAFQRHQGF